MTSRRRLHIPHWSWDGGRLRGRLDDTIAGFLDLVETSTHYPCVKRAWVEFLGERPDPAVDRVDT
jgi:hypothetical protein